MTDTATAVAPAPTTASLTREYVAGMSDGWLAAVRSRVRSLPIYVDSLEAELGDDSYQRMLTDPQVASAVSLLKAAILEDSVTLTVAPTPQDDAAAADQAERYRARPFQNGGRPPARRTNVPLPLAA
jgi:hypothetical protein